jgi:mitotic spindle assembly checkpoint protein MAD2
VQSEIQAILRQITASVSFLPMLEEACTFDLLGGWQWFFGSG